MKRLYTYTRLVIMAVTAMLITSSCDNDHMLAYDMEGVWQGSITGNYYVDRYHNSDSYDTEIMFKTTGFERGGTGYEIDRRYGSHSFTKTYFDWAVRDGKIYMEYDDGYRIIIRDYETYVMGGRMRFRGYFENYDTGQTLASFNLIKVVDSNDYYENSYYGGSYYARRATPADSTATDSVKVAE